jgi:type IV secretion system protein VirD4
MSPPAKERRPEAWRSPAAPAVSTAPGRLLLAAKVGVGGVIALVALSWLAGMFLILLLGGHPKYASPLTWLQYWYWLSDEPPTRWKLLVSGGVTVAFVLAAAVALLWPKRPPLHGEARFATRREVKRAGLLGEHGIVLGQWGRRYLLLPGQQGVALAAPPRAGKGAGVVIPNALHWPGSMVCIDLKRENWTVTAGYRKACGQECYLFEPFAEDRRTARWNPFHYVSDDPIRRINDLQRIAEMLYPDPPTGDPFWVASARSVFLAIALYVFETGTEQKTIGNVLRHGMAGDEKGFGEYWKGKVEGRKSGPNPLSEYCVRALYDVIDLAPSTASSIRKTFTSRLDLWLNPILDAATSGNDFDLRDLRRKPMSIYVGVNPDDLHRLRPVLNLFFQQAIGLQTRELPEHNPDLKHQVMMLLDEFTALGRIPIIAESISYLPGYNVRVVLVIQTPAQLREVYGPHNAETMLKSLATRIVYAPKDVGDAREISEELGYLTVKVRSQSRPRHGLSSGHRGGGSETTSEQKRALQLPQEIKSLPSDQEIIFYEGLPPIRCGKIRYFTDPVFMKRLLPPPDRPQAIDVTYRVITGRAEATKLAGRAAAPAPDVIVERIGTADDVERIEQLMIDDFGEPVQSVEIRVGPDGRVAEPDLKAAVSQLTSTYTLDETEHRRTAGRMRHG